MMRIGAAKSKAGRAASFIQISLPAKTNRLLATLSVSISELLTCP
jgi:hypothetical protein